MHQDYTRELQNMQKVACQ